MSGLEGLLAGRTLVDRYRIEEVIGRGGFAAVYRAADERLDRTVAVKVITLAAPDEEMRAQLRDRFQREARAAASLPQHPNVVTVYDFGTDPALGLDFLVLEHLIGEDLATHLARQRRLPVEAAQRVLRDAIEGIAVGHRAGLIHRDVKPSNIFLAEPHGGDPFRVCVLDFGIARVATQDQTSTRLTTGGVPLSPAYASPEQLRGDRNLTPATDVFSLGVVAYQLLTGQKPLRADRTAEPADWVPDRGIRDLNSDVEPPVAAVVKRAMCYDVEDRYPNADALAAALDEAISGVPAAPRVAAPIVPPRSTSTPDEDHTLLHPAAHEAPPPRAAAVPPAAGATAADAAEAAPGRRPAVALWVVVLVAALVTVAGLWAFTRGAVPDQPSAGDIILEQGDTDGDGPVQSTSPRVTGEIIDEPVAPTPDGFGLPGELPPPSGGVQTTPAPPAPTAEPREGVILPPAGGAPAQGGPQQPTPAPTPGAQPQQPQPQQPQPQQPQPQQPQQPQAPQPQQPAAPQADPAADAEPAEPQAEPSLLGVPAVPGGGGGGGSAGGPPDGGRAPDRPAGEISPP